MKEEKKRRERRGRGGGGVEGGNQKEGGERAQRFSSFSFSFSFSFSCSFFCCSCGQYICTKCKKFLQNLKNNEAEGGKGEEEEGRGEGGQKGGLRVRSRARMIARRSDPPLWRLLLLVVLVVVARTERVALRQEMTSGWALKKGEVRERKGEKKEKKC